MSVPGQLTQIIDKICGHISKQVLEALIDVEALVDKLDTQYYTLMQGIQLILRLEGELDVEDVYDSLNSLMEKMEPLT